MAGCDGWITIKIIELLFVTFCMIYKRVTDDEANKLFYFLQKFSREWPLLNNITWEENGAIFADITYGSYIIIIIGLIIGQCSGELQRCRKMENYFLIIGAILFIATGSLELAALESVEERLVDNAAILGVFTLVTGFIFIIDLLTASKRRKRAKLNYIQKSTLSKLTQTEEKNNHETTLMSDMNGNTQNGVSENGGHRIPKNAVKLLPSSPILSEYVLTSQKHPNNDYLGPVEYYIEPPDGNDLKTHEGRIRSTESFLRSEKGLYPNLRKISDHDHERPSNHYVIPTGYVLVPAEQFRPKSSAKSDSGMGDSYTSPNYSKITPTTKNKYKKEHENYVMIPVDQNFLPKDSHMKPPMILSKTSQEAYYTNGKDNSSDSWQPHGSNYKANSSDVSDYEVTRSNEPHKYELKQSKSQKRQVNGLDNQDKNQKYLMHSEESSDEQKSGYYKEDYSRPSSRFSQESREWHRKHKGKVNEGYFDDKDNFSYSKRASSYRKSTSASPLDKPKSILRFDYGRSSKKESGLAFNKNLQYDSLDSKKIAEDLRTLKEITKVNVTQDFEPEDQILKQRFRKENEEKEKTKRSLKKMKKAGQHFGDSEEEKDRRVSEREEQYFGLKDLKQSHIERKFEPLTKTKSLDESLKREIEEAGKSTKEISERFKEKYFEHESQASREAQEFRDLIDERFYFLDEEEKWKKKKDSKPQTIGKFQQHHSDHGKQTNFSEYGKNVEKQRSDSDETNYTQSTEEEIRLRVETPGNTSYKSEALVWVDNHRESQTQPSTPISPASPGYVLYTAQNWPESPSPQDRFHFNAKEAQQLSIKPPPKTPLLERLKSDFSTSSEKINSQKSRLLDFDEISDSLRQSVTRPKGFLMKKNEGSRQPDSEMKKPPVIAGSTSTWKKWLQPKPKLIPTHSAPN